MSTEAKREQEIPLSYMMTAIYQLQMNIDEESD